MTGDKIDLDSALVICNHRSLADHILIEYLLRSENQIKIADKTANNDLIKPRINFFSWFSLWKIPSIKTLVNMTKCDENWELDKKATRFLFKNVINSKHNEWIVLFPEVNIWSKETYMLQKKQMEDFFLPKLSNVLYPRFSPFYNLISSLNIIKNNKFKKLYDVTIFYNVINKDKSIKKKNYFYLPSLLEIFSFDSEINVTIHVKTRSISKIPAKRKKLEKYLEDLWVEKNDFIGQMTNKNFINKNV